METLEYRFPDLDKSSWGEGPWQTEVDKRQWPDEATGLPCLAVRHPSHGHWCGYVGVPEGHPYFGVSYGEVGSEFRGHHGVNFSHFCDGEEYGVCHVAEPGEPEHVWWFGFDCGHVMDFSPGHEASMDAIMPNRTKYKSLLPEVYRDLPYVVACVTDLARQLAEVGAAAATR